MNLKSKYLRQFIQEIQYHNRNPKDIKALELLDDISTNPEIVIETSALLYRCRIVVDKKDIGKEKNFHGYNAQGSFVPPPKSTRDMRANYRYIPYLYCANNPYISLVEVRPPLGSLISIATIEVTAPIRLLDFTVQQKPSQMTEAKKNLFLDLSMLYSTPVANTDDILDYIPTQYIAEYAKSKGYDGIAFSSSLVPEVNKKYPERYNVVVFNYHKCFVKKSNLIAVKGIDIEGEQVDEDIQNIDIRSYISEELDAIHQQQMAIINQQNNFIKRKI